jgi:hypothetical protein
VSAICISNVCTLCLPVSVSVSLCVSVSVCVFLCVSLSLCLCVFMCVFMCAWLDLIPTGKRSQSRNRTSRKPSTAVVGRSMDDSFVRYTSQQDSRTDPTTKPSRVSSRQQARNLQHLTAPTFSSAVRTLDIAGVDIATVQAMAAASPLGNVSQLSISGGGKKGTKSRK